MALSQDQVLEKLKNVIDPELFVNIVDLGLIYEIKFAEQEVESEGDSDEPKTHVLIDMTMTSPACPAGPQILGQSHAAIERLDGVSEAYVKLVMQPPWTPDRMTEDARDQLGIF